MGDQASAGFDMFRFQSVPWPVLLEDVRQLEAIGARTVWIADHYAWPPQPEAPVLEAWTALAALAAATERVRLGTAVTDVALRHPALLAKQAATVDRISEGRLELAVGAGFYERELAWLAIPFLTPGGRARRLREAVEIIDALLRNGRLSYQGEHYRLDDAPLVPEPVQRPRPPLLVAANGKKGLRLAAERADTSLSLGDEDASSDEALEALRERNDYLDERCAELGRDPLSLGRAYFVGWAEEYPFASAEALHDFIGRYRDAGARRFIFLFARETRDGRFATRETLDAYAADILAAWAPTSA